MFLLLATLACKHPDDRKPVDDTGDTGDTDHGGGPTGCETTGEAGDQARDETRDEARGPAAG